MIQCDDWIAAVRVVPVGLYYVPAYVLHAADCPAVPCRCASETRPCRGLGHTSRAKAVRLAIEVARRVGVEVVE